MDSVLAQNGIPFYPKTELFYFDFFLGGGGVKRNPLIQKKRNAPCERPLNTVRLPSIVILVYRLSSVSNVSILEKGNWCV